MKANEKLSQIAKLLNLSTELATVKTKDGTEFMVDEMKVGSNAYIKTDEGEKVALPDGDYTLDSGEVIEVKEGKITEIEKSEPAGEQEAAKDDKKEMTYATKEELAEVKKGVDELKSMIEEMAKKEDKKEMSSQNKKPEKEPKQKSEKEELSVDKPIKGAPKKEEKKEQIKFGSHSNTIGNSIMSRIADISK